MIHIDNEEAHSIIFDINTSPQSVLDAFKFSHIVVDNRKLESESSTTSNESFEKKKQFWETFEHPIMPQPMPKPRIAGYMRESTDTDVTSLKSSISREDEEILDDVKFPISESYDSKTSEHKGEKSEKSSSDVDRIDSLDESETDAKATKFYIGDSSKNIIVKTSDLPETKDEMEKSTGELPIDKSEIEVSEKLSRQHSLEDDNKTNYIIEEKRSGYQSMDDGATFESEKPLEFLRSNLAFAQANSVEVVKEVTLGKSAKDHLRLETSPRKTNEEIDFEKTLEEVEDSLEAVQEKLIEVVKDGKLIKQSPSEFEIKILPDLKYPASIPEQEESPSTPKKDSKNISKYSEKSIKSETEDSQHSSNEDSNKKSDVVVIRHKKVDIIDSGSNRCSATDIESSSESHYQSFEKNDSRPMSSDVENAAMRSYQSSEYETAQDQSIHPGSSTLDYHSAVSTLSSNKTISSHDSMKSLDSESSGNLASIETASDISETLVPSIMDEYEEKQSTTYLSSHRDELDDTKESFSSLETNISTTINDEESSLPISSVMKRSHEMTFPSDIKPFVDSVDLLDDSKLEDRLNKSVEDLKYGSWEEHRFGSSLEEGSMLSVSISSASNLETMVEVQGEGADMMDSFVGSYDSGKIYSSFQDDQLFMLDSQPNVEFPSEFSRTSPTLPCDDSKQDLTDKQQTSEEMKKRGHKRTDSTTVFPSSFIKVGSTSSDSFEDDIVLQEESSDIISSEKDETHGESSDSEFDRFETEYSRAFKSPMTSKTKSVKDDDKKLYSPGHSMIETIVEDVNAEVEMSSDVRVRKDNEIYDNEIPNIQVTGESSLLSSQQQEKQSSISGANVAESSSLVGIKYAKQSEYKMSEEEYQNLIEQKYKSRFDDFTGSYDDNIQDEENQRLSPGSDSFEMLNEPDLSDEFVIVEEVAKEAQEFDKEGKSLSIHSTGGKKYVKKHDEEMEKYVIKSAPANTDAGSQMLDSAEFEFGDSPPQDEENAEPLRGSGYALEGSKRWVEMNLSDPNNLRYPYELDRGVLEDIKEEENEMEIGSSRISSLKDSYSSTPDYDALIRKLHTSREHDTLSMNSLQEFESLEQVISLENRRQQTQSSQESLSNGSYPKRQVAKSVQGDDISLSSLNDFEGLENACLEAHLIEIRAKEEAALLLSRSDDSSKSSGSSEGNKSSPRATSGSGSSSSKTAVASSVTTITTTAKGKSFTQMEKQMAQEFAILQQRAQEIMGDTSFNIMETSTDSLENNKNSSKLIYDKSSSQHVSNDSLDNNGKTGDPMTSSVDSIENSYGCTGADKRTKESDTDSLNSPVKRIRSDSVDSIEMEQTSKVESSETVQIVQKLGKVEGEKTRTVTQSAAEVKTFTSSVSNDSLQPEPELLLTSTESLTSSTSTNATYRNNDSSQMSGSMTSCDSNTMIDTLDTFYTHSASSSNQNFQTSVSPSINNQKQEYVDDDDTKSQRKK